MSPHGDDPRPLGGDARALLDVARPLERLPAAHKARLKGRVMAAAAVSAGVAAAASAAEAAAAQTAAASAVKVAGLSLLAKVGLGVAVVTIGAGGWVWMQVREHAPARPVATVVAAPVLVDAEEAAEPVPASPAETASNEAPAVMAEVPSAPPAVTVEVPSAAVAMAEPSAPPAAMAATAASTAKVAASAEPAADSLQEETKLLSAAHAALSQGNAAAALGWLDVHAAKFPRGALVPERRAARAMALCRLGRSDEGRREAEALYGKGSKSPLAEKIDRACAK